MADFFLDPEGGNDSNNGTTFALRKKTLAAFTSGILTAGDRIKVMASRDPSSIGNGTWTDNSDSITLATARNVVIHECDADWVAGTNCSINHASFIAARDGNSVTITPSGGATSTPQVFAYVALPATLDLSAYQAVSLSMMCNQDNQKNLVLDLCSDSAGAVPVVSLPFPENPEFASSAWQVALLEAGGNLPSNVNSIALRAATAFGSGNTIRLDNIVACKAASDPNHLSHRCLIGKNTAGEPEWYPIRAIKGTTIRLGNIWTQNAASKKYRGTTETVPTYVRCPTHTGWSDAQKALQKAGTSDTARITISGGWDRTAMASQTGETWITGEGRRNLLMDIGSHDYVSVLNIGFCHSLDWTFWGAFGTRDSFEMVSPGFVSCNSLLFFSGQCRSMTLDLGNLMWNLASQLTSINEGSGLDYHVRRVSGTADGTATGSYTFPANPNLPDPMRYRMHVEQIDNMTGGLQTQYIATTPLAGITFKWNGVDLNIYQQTELTNCKFPLNEPNVSFNGGVGQYCLSITVINGNSWDNRRLTSAGTAKTVEDVYRTATYRSRKLEILDGGHYKTARFPMQDILAHVMVEAGVTTTIDVWVKRPSTDHKAAISVRAGYVDGVAAAQTNASAAADTWEKLSISVTPTQDGILPVYANLWGPVNAIAYFTELGVSP